MKKLSIICIAITGISVGLGIHLQGSGWAGFLFAVGILSIIYLALRFWAEMYNH